MEVRPDRIIHLSVTCTLVSKTYLDMTRAYPFKVKSGVYEFADYQDRHQIPDDFKIWPNRFIALNC